VTELQSTATGWSLRRKLWIAAGLVFTGIAVLGVALPILPTTPFLLLASWCFARSSPRLQAWLRQSKLFGPMLADWERERGVSLPVKVGALGSVALAIVLGFVCYDLVFWQQVVLLVLASVGVTVICLLRTVEGNAK
jgi:uncharacterized membrane protein YbaN (DUF454 family)